MLTLNVPCISESYNEIKIKLNFYFHTSLWCLKRSVKKKNFNVIFSLSGIGTGRVKHHTKKCENKNLTLFFRFVPDWDSKG